MIRRRLAIFALLVGCGGALPKAPTTVSIPKITTAKTPTIDDAEAARDGRWWTRLSIPNGGHQVELLPIANGGVRAFIKNNSEPNWGAWESKAAFVDVDAAGHEGPVVSVIQGISVNTGEARLGAKGEVVFAGNYDNAFGVMGVKITNPSTHQSSTRPPMYLATVDAHGALAWSHTFDDAQLRSLARRSDGVIVVAGRLPQQGDFGGGTIGVRTASSTFIAAFDAHGKHLFSRAFQTQDNFDCPRVAIASDGTIELFANLGPDLHEIDFGDRLHRGIKSAATAMVSFDDHGKCLKSSIISLLAKNVAIDVSGDVVLSGDTTEEDLTKRSLLVMRVDGDGHEMWRHEFPSDGSDVRWAPLAIDAKGNVLTAFRGPASNEEGMWNDVYIFDRGGNEVYRERMLGEAWIGDVAFSPDGDAFIAGESRWKPISCEGDVLPVHPHFLPFVMKLPK